MAWLKQKGQPATSTPKPKSPWTPPIIQQTKEQLEQAESSLGLPQGTISKPKTEQKAGGGGSTSPPSPQPQYPSDPITQPEQPRTIVRALSEEEKGKLERGEALGETYTPQATPKEKLQSFGKGIREGAGGFIMGALSTVASLALIPFAAAGYKGAKEQLKETAVATGRGVAKGLSMFGVQTISPTEEKKFQTTEYASQVGQETGALSVVAPFLIAGGMPKVRREPGTVESTELQTVKVRDVGEKEMLVEQGPGYKVFKSGKGSEYLGEGIAKIRAGKRVSKQAFATEGGGISVSTGTQGVEKVYGKGISYTVEPTFTTGELGPVTKETFKGFQVVRPDESSSAALAGRIKGKPASVSRTDAVKITDTRYAFKARGETPQGGFNQAGLITRMPTGEAESIIFKTGGPTGPALAAKQAGAFPGLSPASTGAMQAGLVAGLKTSPLYSLSIGAGAYAPLSRAFLEPKTKERAKAVTAQTLRVASKEAQKEQITTAQVAKTTQLWPTTPTQKQVAPQAQRSRGRGAQAVAQVASQAAITIAPLTTAQAAAEARTPSRVPYTSFMVSPLVTPEYTRPSYFRRPRTAYQTRAPRRTFKYTPTLGGILGFKGIKPTKKGVTGFETREPIALPKKRKIKKRKRFWI